MGKRKESGLKRIISFPGLNELSHKFLSGEISEEEFQERIENLEPEYTLGSLKLYDDMPDINESSRE